MVWASAKSYSFEFAHQMHDLGLSSPSNLDLAVVSAQKKNGSYGLQCDFDTDAYFCMFDTGHIGHPSNDSGWFFQMWVKLGSAPSNITNDIALLSHSRGAGDANEIIVIRASGTKGTVRLQDWTGAEVCTTTVVLSESVWTLVSVAWDETLTKAWGVIAFDGVEKASGQHTGQYLLSQSAHSGQRLFYGGKRASGNSGIKVYMDDCDFHKNSVPSDEMPWDVAFPKFRGHGGAEGPPTSDGDDRQWNQSLCGGADQFSFVDEVPHSVSEACTAGNEYMASSTANEVHLFHYSAANPVPSDDKIQDGDSDIPKGHVAMRCIARQQDDTKGTANFRIKLGGTSIGTAGGWAGGEVHRGEATWNLARPGGGNWAQPDWDLASGKSKVQFGVVNDPDDANDRVATIYMPEIFSYDPDDKLAVMTSPPVDGAVTFSERGIGRGIKQGVARGV